MDDAGVGDEALAGLGQVERHRELAGAGPIPADLRTDEQLFVDANATASDDALEEWVARSVGYGRSLPPTASGTMPVSGS